MGEAGAGCALTSCPSKPAGCERVRHYHPDAEAVKGQDGQQIGLAKEIVRHDHRGQHDATGAALGNSPDRYPEVEMLVVAAGQDFAVALTVQGEPRDLLADRIGSSGFDLVEVGGGGCLEAER